MNLKNEANKIVDNYNSRGKVQKRWIVLGLGVIAGITLAIIFL